MKWWPTWVRWMDAGRIPSQRPASLPKRIPLRAFDCYKQLHHDYGVLVRTGAMVDNPYGGYEREKITAARQAGLPWIALNARDHSDWTIWRGLCAVAGIEVVPWGRGFDGDPADPNASRIAEESIQFLYETAKRWGSPGVILNVEDEAETVLTPTRIAEITKDWK